MNELIVRKRRLHHDLPVIASFENKINLFSQSRPYSEQCLIDANNDLQAVAAWLEQYSHKNTTYSTYKSESDRLLLWCVHEVGLSLTQLQLEDISKYIKFLSNPPSRWCSTVGDIRLSGYGVGRWRPFLGPLSNSARNTAIRVVNSLLNFLVDAAYLRANPLRLIKQRDKFNVKAEDYKYSVWSKILDDNEWQVLQQVLKDMPETSNFEKDNKMRTQFIFACMYLLGLRISEVAGSTWNAFKFHQGAWWFFVRGKGDKLGHIPVNEQLLKCVKSYRSYLGKPHLPSETDTAYLIVSKKTRQPLSTKQMYSLIKTVSKRAALKFEEGSISRQKLEKLSPHSLRHLSASHQDKLGVPMNIIQENLRHLSIHTTKIYVHADDVTRHKEMNKMMLDIAEEDAKLQAKELCLSISLSGSNVCTKYALEKFLYMIESKILYDFAWHRMNNIDLPSIIAEYENAAKLGSVYNMNYVLTDFNLDDVNILEKIKNDIAREAEVRLFKIV